MTRMAGLLARGSLPPCAFPVSQWPMQFGSPLTVAGAAADSGPRIESSPTAFPFHPPGSGIRTGEPTRTQRLRFFDDARQGRRRRFPLTGPPWSRRPPVSHGRNLTKGVEAPPQVPDRRAPPVETPPARRPDAEAPAPAPHDRDIGGQNEEPERHHPEAEDRQETDKPQEDQQYADAYSDDAVCREGDAGIAEPDRRHICLPVQPRRRMLHRLQRLWSARGNASGFALRCSGRIRLGNAEPALL